MLGTYPYMAPEQLAGQEADARSDIFALGAIIHEMATGRRAFDGTTAARVIGAVLHADPPLVSTLQPQAPAGAGPNRRAISRQGSRESLAIGTRPRAPISGGSLSNRQRRPPRVAPVTTKDSVLIGVSIASGLADRWSVG